MTDKTLDNIENLTHKMAYHSSGYTPLPNATIHALVATVRAADNWSQHSHVPSCRLEQEAKRQYREVRHSLDCSGLSRMPGDKE